ncbi:hypothetical protein [Nitrospirillum sp. BR 11163]|uniref:hypothetical protein n=1 Tax=Nitrospirillum sp. BR 11163 TaxID=3104323 RepID=UPI002AFFF11C|nr:hypothetical protein [Nitrospirillum sp. BR 11163]MEA1674081.1 hypothetical protein [Nitrospirillum sp. BR 11163]
MAMANEDLSRLRAAMDAMADAAERFIADPHGVRAEAEHAFDEGNHIAYGSGRSLSYSDLMMLISVGAALHVWRQDGRHGWADVCAEVKGAIGARRFVLCATLDVGVPS